MHQIAKINHCETSILGGNGIAVKLAALRGHRYPLCDSGWNGIAVFLEALNVTGDRVFGHTLSFRERSPVGYASGQHRNNGCEAALWLGPEHHIEVTA